MIERDLVELVERVASETAERVERANLPLVTEMLKIVKSWPKVEGAIMNSLAFEQATSRRFEAAERRLHDIERRIPSDRPPPWSPTATGSRVRVVDPASGEVHLIETRVAEAIYKQWSNQDELQTWREVKGVTKWTAKNVAVFVLAAMVLTILAHIGIVLVHP